MVNLILIQLWWRGFKGVHRPHRQVERRRAHPGREVHGAGVRRDHQIKRAHAGGKFRQAKAPGAVGPPWEASQPCGLGRGLAFGRPAKKQGAQTPAQQQRRQTPPESGALRMC